MQIQVRFKVLYGLQTAKALIFKRIPNDIPNLFNLYLLKSTCISTKEKSSSINEFTIEASILAYLILNNHPNKRMGLDLFNIYL